MFARVPRSLLGTLLRPTAMRVGAPRGNAAAVSVQACRRASSTARSAQRLAAAATVLRDRPDLVVAFVADLEPDVRAHIVKTASAIEAAETDEEERHEAAARAVATHTKAGYTAPSRQQLRMHFNRVALPFVGFGFLDNAIMLIAGDRIDSTIGVTLCISTLAAAGLGNMISDLAGLGLGGIIERMSDRMGLVDPDFTKEQRRARSTYYVDLAGRVVGISVGCILGLFPLLFLDGRPAGESKPAAREHK